MQGDLQGVTKKPKRSGWGIWVFGIITLVLAACTVGVGVQQTPNKLATALLQVMTVLFGVLTSYIYSKISTRDAAREIIRPHARASIRRSVNLYRALERQVDALIQHYETLQEATRQDDKGREVVDISDVAWSISGLQHLVTEQLATAADSLEDWRDIVPEEVEKIFREDQEKGKEITL